MSVSWNCRGLGNPSSVRTLKDLVSRFKPTFVFLMEVKVNRVRIDAIKNQIQFEGLFLVEGVSRGGGVAFMWKEKHSAKLISFSKNYIDLQIRIPHRPLWRLTGFYGFPERQRRKDSWELLRQLKVKSNLPWCCVGDFNNILSHFEKRGGRKQPDYLINGFRDAVDDYGLREVIMSGYPFTWECTRGCANWVEEKLDRALASDE